MINLKNNRKNKGINYQRINCKKTASVAIWAEKAKKSLTVASVQGIPRNFGSSNPGPSKIIVSPREPQPSTSKQAKNSKKKTELKTVPKKTIRRTITIKNNQRVEPSFGRPLTREILRTSFLIPKEAMMPMFGCLNLKIIRNIVTHLMEQNIKIKLSSYLNQKYLVPDKYEFFKRHLDNEITMKDGRVKSLQTIIDLIPIHKPILTLPALLEFSREKVARFGILKNSYHNANTLRILLPSNIPNTVGFDNTKSIYNYTRSPYHVNTKTYVNGQEYYLLVNNFLSIPGDTRL